MRKLILCSWNRGVTSNSSHPPLEGGWLLFSHGLSWIRLIGAPVFSVRCPALPSWRPALPSWRRFFDLAIILAGKLAVFIHKTAKTFIATSSLFLGEFLFTVSRMLSPREVVFYFTFFWVVLIWRGGGADFRPLGSVGVLNTAQRHEVTLLFQWNKKINIYFF